MYIAALLIITLVFFRNAMEWYMYQFGIIETFAFFYFSNILSKRWASISSKTFTNKIFYTSLFIRFVWVIFSYFFYLLMTGQPFEFHVGDAMFYHDIATQFSKLGISHYNEVFSTISVSDRGYATYLGIVYLIFGPNILIARIIKSFLGAFTAVLVYRFATRIFDEKTGRLSAILVMLMPNLILYTGQHLKEVEMVFLIALFLERTAHYIYSKKHRFIDILIPLLLIAVFFTFRTILGITALFSLGTTLLFSTNKILGFGQRFITGVWVILLIGFFMGGKIAGEVETVWQNRNLNNEETLEWKANKAGGNTFANKLSTAVAAPLIFTIPFPSMINTPEQENQRIINGGNFAKNVMAFFVLYALFLIIKNKTWRRYTLLGSFMLGYLGILATNSFVVMERFHQPVIPVLMIFAAYGILNATNKTKKYFNAYLALLFVMLIAWNYVKLKGQGLI